MKIKSSKRWTIQVCITACLLICSHTVLSGAGTCNSEPKGTHHVDPLPKCSDKRAKLCHVQIATYFDSLQELAKIEKTGPRSANGEIVWNCWDTRDALDVWEAISISFKYDLISTKDWLSLALKSKNQLLKFQVLNNLVGSAWYKPAIQPLINISRGKRGELPDNLMRVLSQHPDSDQAAAAMVKSVKLKGYPYEFKLPLLAMVGVDVGSGHLNAKLLGVEIDYDKQTEWHSFINYYFLQSLLPWRLYFGIGHPRDWIKAERMEELDAVSMAWYGVHKNWFDKLEKIAQ